MFPNSYAAVDTLDTDTHRLVSITSKLAFERLRAVWGVATTQAVTTQVVNVLVSEVEAGEQDEFLLQQYAVEAGVHAHRNFVELLTSIQPHCFYRATHAVMQGSTSRTFDL